MRREYKHRGIIWWRCLPQKILSDLIDTTDGTLTYRSESSRSPSSSSEASSRANPESDSPHQFGSTSSTLVSRSCNVRLCFVFRACLSCASRRSSIRPPVHPCSRIATSSNKRISLRPGKGECAVTMSRAVSPRFVTASGEDPCVARYDTRVGGASRAA